MPIVIILMVFGVVFAGLGLLVEALAWALVVGLVLLVAGVLVGASRRGRANA